MIKSSPWLLVILGALMAFTSLSTDVYLPAMPQMAAELQGNVELTVTGFLVGFAIAQLIWGAVSDRIGRKIPLYIGMVLFVIGSIGCAFSHSINEIVFWRIFQAFGACTAPLLARAIIRDLFDKSRAVQMLSTLTMIMAVAPIIGPLLGGQIVQFGNWKMIFILLAMIGIVMFFSLFALPETLPKEQRTSGRFWTIFRNYRQLLQNHRFMRYTLCVTFFYVGAYAFVVGSPQVYIEHFNVAPQHYGWLFALNIVGIMLFSLLNKTLSRRFALELLLKISTAIAAFASILMSLMVYFNISGIYAVIIPIFLFFSMNGIIASCATASALDLVPTMAGSGAALIGSLQYGSGIISSLLLVCFSDGTASAMAWIIGVFALLSAATMLNIYEKNS
ncbi:multidrug effflux MFS transporter [Actinobacillus suis]|uniref:multidrug effflux MFS transporter n=1 Tax=Actinobacillus suis TaxID=716 RepID=UPI00207CD202|nr:multidrug effflux MFS transporter [Actinobacillus suis]MCO4168269.1 multidrug effflux MFS transporter [Actinobacillus suis]